MKLIKKGESSADVKDQIIKYVQALETSYTASIGELKVLLDRQSAEIKKLRNGGAMAMA